MFFRLNFKQTKSRNMKNDLDFEQKYNIIKKIGSGAFSEVFLVQDPEGHQYALKKIQKNNIDMSVLYREILIMESLRKNNANTQKKNQFEKEIQIWGGSKYVAQIYDWEQSQDYINLLIEYFDLGDLRKDLNNYPPLFVYELDEAKKILADIIRGLVFVHAQGYVHRDIKLENILVKNMPGQQKKVFKIGDFGISKDVSKNKTKTVLGTRQYMSPQIFQGKDYRFEVDMWALGVLFCFMLNRSYPFKINPMIDDFKEISKSITQQAKNFSYKEFVSNTKTKLTKNCSVQLEDLFQKIFQINPNKRLNFIEIREHPVFKQLFKDEKKSYTTKIYEYGYSQIFTIKQEQLRGTGIITTVQKGHQTIQSKFQKQMKALLNKNSQIDLLLDMFHQVKNTDIFNLLEKLPLSYNLLKFYLVRKTKFLKHISSKQIAKRYPELKMKQFLSSKSSEKIIIQIQESIQKVQLDFINIKQQCSDILIEILKINPRFKENLDCQIPIKKYHILKFEGDFKLSYRQATQMAYQIIKRNYQKKLTKKLSYMLTMILICHFFNRIFSKKQIIQYVFSTFFQQTGVKPKYLDFQKLKHWLKNAPPKKLNETSIKIIQVFDI